MAKTVSVAEAKRDFSEILSRAALRRERFIIARKGKPVAALISVDELDLLPDRPADERGQHGLLAAVGAWEEHPRIDQLTRTLSTARRKAKDRRGPRLR
ncbi:MAG: type II toxin-antitoxin system Phd/YefM family antitoxin [Nitrospiria bacterium]